MRMLVRLLFVGSDSSLVRKALSLVAKECKPIEGALCSCGLEELEETLQKYREETNWETFCFLFGEDAHPLWPFARANANVFLDPRNMTEGAFARTLVEGAKAYYAKRFFVRFMSFGYKRGVPADLELALDCRLAPNPYWVEELKQKSGLDAEVVDYLEGKEDTQRELRAMEDYLDHYLEAAEKEPRRGHAFIGFGCTGGQHRSVYFAQKMYERYASKYSCMVIHREQGRSW